MFLQLTDLRGKFLVGAPAPTVASANRTLLKFLIPAAILAIAVRVYFAKVVLPDRLCDDCYTTLRYAANLAQGNGFVFNIGESVWGTTTPLLTLILSLTAFVFGVSALETATVAFGIVGYAVFWLLLFKIFEESLVPRLISMPVILFAMFGPAFLENSLSGMETALVLALMAGSYLCYMKDRPIGLGMLFALLLLARIDTLVWSGIVGGAYILRHLTENRRRIFLALAAFLLVALPWHVFALVKFQSLIPQTVTAKAVTNNMLHLSYWSYIVEFCRVYFPAGALLNSALPVLSLLAILIVGGVAVWRQYPLLRPLPVFWFCFNAFFIGAKAQLFSWYLPPTKWLAYFLVLAGFYAAWNQYLTVRKHIALQLAPWCLLFALLAFHCVSGDYRFYQDRSKPNPWTDLANYISYNTSPDDRIFLEHIGLVGYRSMRPILDDIGLVSPDILQIRRQHPETWIPESLRKHRPEVVVLYGWQLPDYEGKPWPAEDRNWFSARYEQKKIVEVDAKTTNYVYVQKHSPANDIRGTSSP
jgi:hypothetical protein